MSAMQCFGFSELVICADKPGLAPAGDSLLQKPAKLVFFACQRRAWHAGFAHFALQSYANTKSKQKKGEPAVCVPQQSCGQPAVLAAGGGPLVALRATLLGACDWRQAQKFLDKRLSKSARAKQSATGFAAVESGLSSAADCGNRAGDCLSEASSSQTPQAASSARNRAAALTSARFLFAYFLLARQEKVSRPPGRDPACNDHQPSGENCHEN
jgi:hypothetical protein